MKIYVITKGEYSDYHICAATTDKDRAEFLRKMASTTGIYGKEARIEEYDDYTGLTPMKGELYEVMIVYNKNGEERNLFCNTENFVDDKTIPNTIRYKEEKFHGMIESAKKHNGECWYSVLVVAESDEKAKKIGIDLIQKYRAEELGI